MKYSIIQKIMIEKILDENSGVKLGEFYDIFAYDLIEDDVELRLGNNYNKIEHKIDVVDITKVASFLINRNKLSTEEIHSFVLYLNDVFKPSLMSNSEFLYAYENISGKLKTEIGALDVEIKKYKNQEKMAKELVSISNRKEIAIDSKIKISSNKRFIKIAISELEKIRFTLPFNRHKNKKELLLKKHIKYYGNDIELRKPEIEDEYIVNMHHAFTRLGLLIDSRKITDEEITTYVVNLISSIDIKDGRIRKDIVNIIGKLKERLKQTSKEYKSVSDEIKNLESLIDEYENLDVIDEDTLEEYKNHKKELKSIYSLLSSLKEDIHLSNREFKEAIRSERNLVRRNNKNESEQSISTFKEKKYYLDEDLGDKDFFDGLGFYSEKQSNLILTRAQHTFKDYRSSQTPRRMYYLVDEKGSSVSHNYAVSLEEKENQTVVRLHVLNVAPYLSKDVSGFLLDDYYKKLNYSFEPDKYLSNGIAGYLKFKNDQVLPTIAYTFTFDRNYQLKDFNIEQCDGILKTITPEENTILNVIYDMNNTEGNYKRSSKFWETLLQEEFIKYAVNKNLPIIYYGRYLDESYGKYKAGVKIGYQKMDDRLAKLSDLLEDFDRNLFNNVCFKWFKNYRMKHFSMEYDPESYYYLEDIGIINPATFMGYNLQQVINECVFNHNYENSSSYQKIVKDQQEYIKHFNDVIGYIELEDFIELVSEAGQLDNKGKKKF